MHKVHIPRSARRDIREAALWYNEQSAGLGKQFTLTVANKIRFIRENPYAYAVRYRDVRVAPLRQFPFNIHFKFYEKRRTITINAVFHTSLNPQTWHSRKQ